MKQFLIKVLDLFLLMGYLMGTIGGIGTTLYQKEWVLSVAVFILALMAFPTAMYVLSDLKGEE